MKIQAITMFCLVMAGASAAHAANMIVNGDFSNGISGWTDTSVRMGSGSSYTGNIHVVSYDGHANAAQFNSLSGSNYYKMLEQEFTVTNPADHYDFSFDWAVPTKESSWGKATIELYFYDATDDELGRIIYYNSSYSSHSSGDDDLINGGLPAGTYITDLRYRETFGWESVAVSTADMPAMDHSQIARIWMRIVASNDAGRGNDMYVDNFMLTPMNGNAIPAPLAAIVGCGLLTGVASRRRKR